MYHITFNQGTFTLTIILPNGNKQGYRVPTAEDAHSFLARNGYRVIKITGRDGVSGVYALGTKVA